MDFSCWGGGERVRLTGKWSEGEGTVQEPRVTEEREGIMEKMMSWNYL